MIEDNLHGDASEEWAGGGGGGGGATYIFKVIDCVVSALCSLSVGLFDNLWTECTCGNTFKIYVGILLVSYFNPDIEWGV